ncbi:MAG TPA: response regulator transcription factor [Anaerolineales bacterium]|jgi:two-component system KDP operon response regulator KdpE
MTHNPLVLIVDDEKSLRDFVRRNLEVRGFRTITASNGLEALALFGTQSIDLVILDIMMPQLDGLDTTRRIRQVSKVPIIILTALGEQDEKVRAFDLGVDDYLTKPFGTGELLGRVKAVLRRTQWTDIVPEQESIVRGEIVADLVRHRVTVRDVLIEMTPTEFNLLVFLMKNAGKVLTHRMILQHVWGVEYGDETEYLRVYMGKLRQKVEQDAIHPRYIQTARGIGYHFES